MMDPDFCGHGSFLGATMEEDQVTRRLEELEARVSEIETTGARKYRSLAELEPEFARTVLRCTPRALERWLRELPFEMKRDVFYGVPRSMLLRLRDSISARSWAQLVEAWQEGEKSTSRKEWVIDEALRTFQQFLEMGYFDDNAPDGPIELGVFTTGNQSEDHWDQARMENRQRLDQAVKEAKEWLGRELPE